MPTFDPQPFRIAVSDEQLADLNRRLDNTRWPPGQVNDDNWSYGTDLDYLKDFCHYWRHSYNWREREAAINRFEQFLATVDGQQLHFIHQRSPHEDATPIVITHGWPGSIVEFLKIIEPLTEPEKHGGSAADAFHVVCPSLPGYAYSPSAEAPGMNPMRVGGLQAQLMAGLGYGGYIAQGGDWGAMISTEMGRQDPGHCIGVHLNMVIGMPPAGEGDPKAALSKEERARVERGEAFQNDGMGYFHIQSTRPQTLAYGLSDSPAGLAGWIIEKFRSWSDCEGDLAKCYTRDELLDNIALYWFSGSIGSSTRIYYEMMHGDLSFDRIEVPTGAALFPRELMNAPRAWAEASYNIVHWQSHPSGGHFAAMEQPAALVGDLREFKRALGS